MAGRLSVIVGPMFSGKSTELVRRLELAVQDGKSIQAFRPKKDTRDGEDQLVTHDGKRWPAIRVAAPQDILLNLKDGVEIVGIDESNMLGEDLPNTCLALMRLGIDVLVAGLNLDYLARPFPPMPELMCLADEVVTKTSQCRVCESPARFSQRIVLARELILPGGEEDYEPRCVVCYEPDGISLESRVEISEDLPAAQSFDEEVSEVPASISKPV